jgi:ribosomal protein L19E
MRARGRGAGTRGAARHRGLPEFIWTGPVRAIKTQFFATKVHQVMKRKVEDLTTLYNFHKGSKVFFSTDFAGTSCQL